MRIGIIDLGTNSIRLLVYERRKDGSLAKVLQEKEMVQLGENLFETLLITPEAHQRTLRALKNFSKQMKRLEVSEIHAIGTCAMREATNAMDLKKEVEKETGISLEIISGEREAELIAHGIISAHGPFKKPQLLVDIGGGSTEVTIVHKDKILASKSLNLGAVRCQERELQRSLPPTEEGIKALRHNIREERKSILEALDDSDFPKSLIGSSGSIRAILRIHCGDQSTSPSCTRDELTGVINQLIIKTYDELRSSYNFEMRRAQVITAAAVILDELVEIFSIDKIQAVPQGLKDGIVAELEGR